MIALLPSLTTANRLQKICRARGLNTYIIQAPKALSTGGCAYALEFDGKHRALVSEGIRAAGSRSKGFFECENNAYKKVGAVL